MILTLGIHTHGLLYLHGHHILTHWTKTSWTSLNDVLYSIYALCPGKSSIDKLKKFKRNLRCELVTFDHVIKLNTLINKVYSNFPYIYHVWPFPRYAGVSNLCYCIRNTCAGYTKIVIYVCGCRHQKMHGNESFSQDLISNTIVYPPTKLW